MYDSLHRTKEAVKYYWDTTGRSHNVMTKVKHVCMSGNIIKDSYLTEEHTLRLSMNLC